MNLDNIENFFSNLEEKFPRHIWILGISGWGDSTFLARIVKRALDRGKISPAKVVLANVDHGQRAESSFEQQELKKKWGKVFEMRLHKLGKGKLSERKMRQERMKFFESIANEYVQPALLFLGHNLTDRIETTVLNLLRGAGIKWFLNMRKIDYQPEGRKIIAIIRPLLDLPGEDIREFLNTQKIIFFEDKTNEDITVSKRNLVRKHMTQVFSKQDFDKKLFYHSWKQIYEEVEQKIEGNLQVDLVALPHIWIKGQKHVWFKTIIDPLRFEVKKLQKLLDRIGAYEDITQSLLREMLIFIVATKRGIKYFKWRNFIKHDQKLYLLKWAYKFWKNWATSQDMKKMYGVVTLPPKWEEMLASWLSVSKWIKKNKIPIFLKDILPAEKKNGKLYILKDKLWKFL